MPRVCTICSHEKRGDIEAALLAGDPLRNIAKRFGTSTTALYRHKDDHIPNHLAKAQEAGEIAKADDLLAQVQSLQASALGILGKAEAAGDLRTALGAIREARGNLELLAKLLGELQQEGTVNITLAPEWLELRAVILQAVAPFPDAQRAILEAVRESS